MWGVCFIIDGSLILDERNLARHLAMCQIPWRIVQAMLYLYLLVSWISGPSKTVHHKTLGVVYHRDPLHQNPPPKPQGGNVNRAVLGLNRSISVGQAVLVTMDVLCSEVSFWWLTNIRDYKKVPSPHFWGSSTSIVFFSSILGHIMTVCSSMMGDASRPSCQIVTHQGFRWTFGRTLGAGFRALVGRDWREPAGDMDMKRCMLQLKFKKSLLIPCGAWHLAPFLIPFVVFFGGSYKYKLSMNLDQPVTQNEHRVNTEIKRCSIVFYRWRIWKSFKILHAMWKQLQVSFQSSQPVAVVSARNCKNLYPFQQFSPNLLGL